MGTENDDALLASVALVRELLYTAKEYITDEWGKWAIVRLANQASISGSGYDWTIIENDTRDLGGKLCYRDPTPDECSEIYGETGTGVFEIYPFGNDNDALTVFCDFNLEPAGTYLEVDSGKNFLVSIIDIHEAF